MLCVRNMKMALVMYKSLLHKAINAKVNQLEEDVHCRPGLEQALEFWSQIVG